MSKKEKLIQRFNSNPKDFTFDELVTLMGYFGYELESSGKTSGSRVRFVKQGCIPHLLHRPHSYKYLLDYQLKDCKNFLKGEKLL